MRVLLGVSGGVAAYKAAELTRELQRRGAEVQVAMTAGAERFVTPLTFAALSGQQVLSSLWAPETSESAAGDAGPFEMDHIRVAQEIDALVIAPATANVMAKLAHGLADDLLTTIALATTAPVVVAPAMNVNMWEHPATQGNIEILRARGVGVVGPGAGQLACGMVGEGRLAEIAEIADAVFAAGGEGRDSGCGWGRGAGEDLMDDLSGETVLITSGGTREPIDAVRFIGNRSSGKMGLALAAVALARGASVTLVTTAGDSVLPCRKIHVSTAAEMQQAVMTELAQATVVIMAAAVADYGVAQPSPQKLKKRDTLTLELTRNDDILRQVVHERRAETLVIGFAAETENVMEEGRRKLREKGVDAIVANDVSRPDSGFDADRNGGVLLTQEEDISLPMASKLEMAGMIFDHLTSMRKTRSAAHILSADCLMM